MAKTVVGILEGKYRYKTEIKAGAHYIISDEPDSSGGTDQGPDPILITMGGLASCIAMTVRMYTDRKGWNFESLHVEVETDVQRVQPENDLTEEERSFVVDGRLRTIRKNITVAGNLDDAQVKRIGEIAERCPVNRMMNRNVLMKQTIKRTD
jgi:putative redox protein